MGSRDDAGVFQWYAFGFFHRTSRLRVVGYGTFAFRVSSAGICDVEVMMFPSFPLRLLPVGHVVEVDYARHAREMIELVLLTRPGERVNQPDFGCGLDNQLFEPNSEQAAASAALNINAELQQWLDDVIKVEDVQVQMDDGTMIIDIMYTLLQNSTPQKTRIVR